MKNVVLSFVVFYGIFGSAALAYCAPAKEAPVTPPTGDTQLYLPLVQTPIAAFPGAEGFGAGTPGGRGGQVIEVTTLAEEGPGSFRAALAAAGPRIIVFRVGGTIQSTKAFVIHEPFVTIAGQTAPGDGITLRGAPFSIRTHDVVIRGLRVRVGDETTAFDFPDSMNMGDPAYPISKIIVDHSSISWGIDENISTNQESPVSDVTIQWSVISEGLLNNRHPEGAHSMGLLIGDNSQRISIHHNLFAHNNRRNPVMKGSPTNQPRTEVINNVIYNWGERATHFLVGPSYTNLIGNYYRPGLNSTPVKGIHLEESIVAGTKVYVQGNIGPGRASDTQDEWDVVSGSTDYRSLTPTFPGSGITTQSAVQAYDLVLAYAGAISPKRDAIDARIVHAVQTGTGAQINSQREVGGWLAMADGVPPLDSDHDGMPNAWEVSHGLDPNNPADRNMIAPSRYTYLEEYINGLIPLPVDMSATEQ